MATCAVSGYIEQVGMWLIEFQNTTMHHSSPASQFHLASRSLHWHLSASQHTSAHMHPSAGYYHGSELEIWMYLYELICWPADKCLSAGLEPAILDWYSHCDDGWAMHKCYQCRWIWGHAPPEKIWLSEIASEPNATRTTPPVVSAACEFGTLRLLLSQMLLELLTCSFCSLWIWHSEIASEPNVTKTTHL